jgi:periplasmic protein TonB
MFNNLIESKSHSRDFKRRGSFLLFTSAAYGLLFAVIGVVSIYAYDAHLEMQTEDIELVRLVPLEPMNQVNVVRPTPVRGGGSPNGDSHLTQAVRPVITDRIDNPKNVPTGTSTAPVLPSPGNAKLGPIAADPLGDGSPDSGGSGGHGDGPQVIPTTTAPPAAIPKPTPKPVPQIIEKHVINGEAIELPKPPYPAIAKTANVQGTVNVQVLIDEGGRVVSAHAVSGSAFLIPEAVKAAYRARFSPTRIGDQPVKVSGVIVYNFVLN